MKFVGFLLLIALLLGSISSCVMSRAQTATMPSVEFCTLISSPEAYNGKEVRVHGVYAIAGAAVSTFASSSCSAAKSLWVEFNPEFRSCSTGKSVRQLAQMRRKSGFRWVRPHSSVITGVYKSAEVEFVGTFSNSNPFKPVQNSTEDGPLGPILSYRQSADFVFRVACIEKLKPLSRNPF